MSTNVTVEYVNAQRKYYNAKTREQKIAALEEMLSTIPSHKGCEVMKAQLKQRLAKLRDKVSAKSARNTLNIQKEGDAQVAVLGLTQSGKSTLLSVLTNAKPKVSERPYTTTSPEIGTLDYHGVKIQLIEIPSNFNPMFMSLAQNADADVLLYKDEEELKRLKEVILKYNLKNTFIEIKREDDISSIRLKIWNSLDLIRIHTKQPGKKPEARPMVIEMGDTVGDAANRLHKDFLKFFKFARVWGPSAKFDGEKVGMEHVLKDEDILEIHMG
ncbi:MAG: TGS domain-containing protein [Candidatus Aenigmatarchaeota archaeon]